MAGEDARIRYSANYLRRVIDAPARDYLIERGMPRVDAFIEEGPSGVRGQAARAGFLLLGYVGDPDVAFYLEEAGGSVFYLVGERGFFVNSSPQRFVASLESYLEVTYGELAGQDSLVEERLRERLRTVDPAAIKDPDSFWNDTLGDVSMGVYGDDA